MKNCIHILLFLTCFRNFVSSSVMNFYNTEKMISYAQYPSWVDTTDGEGSLEFKFKTNKPNGLMLSCDDGESRKNSLRLQLSSGMLHIYFKMGADDLLSVKEADLGSQWNDMKWHHVKITRKYREITLQIDEHVKKLTSDGNANRLILTSYIFVGGDPDNIVEGFSGCLKDLAYPIGSSPPYPIKRIGEVSDHCLDACSTYAESKYCSNKGRCVKHFNDSIKSCDCMGTGYSGITCSEKETIAFLKKGTIISRSMESLKQFRVNTIQFRFRTNQPSGIIVYSGDSSNHIMVELLRGDLNLKMSLGTGSIVLLAGNGHLHDGEWHSVVIKRYGIDVSLIIDNGLHLQKISFPYYPPVSCHVEEQKVYIGGHKFPLYIGMSESKQNYEGCLQQVHFQEESELIKQATISRNIYTRIDGDISIGCSVPKKYIVISVIRVTPTPEVTDLIEPPTTNHPIDSILHKERQLQENTKNRLSQSTVAWITGGICVGSIAMILTLACGFHFLRKRYSGQFLTDDKGRKRKGGYGTTTESLDNNAYSTSLKIPRPSTIV